MQNPEDLAKLKASEKDFYKLQLELDAAKLGETDWFEIRTAIEGNTVVREVHVLISKEFVEDYPIAELNKLMTSIGKLPKLKYLCLGQMQGDVETFGQIPVQSMTALLQAGGEKVLWLYMRGLIMTHVYKGSDEEKEDKGDLDATIHDESASRSKRKDVKKKKDKDKKKKKSSKKEKSKAVSDPAVPNAKQKAAKRALDKLGDALVGLKGLKRISFMGHFDDCMHACQLDPLFEGLGSLEELELVLFALTRHNGRVLVDPHALGGFLDTAPKLKECSVIYIELSDDHIDEIASGIANNQTLEELTLSGIGETTPESVGALFRAPHLQKLTLKELTLEDSSVVAMCIALAHCHNLSRVEVQCALNAPQLLALQQMLLVNGGIETLHLHLTTLEDISAPLELVTAGISNSKSKLTTFQLEGRDDKDEVSKMREINIAEWQEVIEGLFQVSTSNTAESSILTLTKV